MENCRKEGEVASVFFNGKLCCAARMKHSLPKTIQQEHLLCVVFSALDKVALHNLCRPQLLVVEVCLAEELLFMMFQLPHCFGLNVGGQKERTEEEKRQAGKRREKKKKWSHVLLLLCVGRFPSCRWCLSFFGRPHVQMGVFGHLLSRPIPKKESQPPQARASFPPTQTHKPKQQTSEDKLGAERWRRAQIHTLSSRSMS